MEANLDGIYVIRTSVCASVLDERETVKAYQSLSQVEQAFRCYKTIDSLFISSSKLQSPGLIICSILPSSVAGSGT
jgi:hypothetical protein